MAHDKRLITLNNAITGSVAGPSIADGTVGVALPFMCDEVTVLIFETAGTGVLQFQGNLWAWQEEIGRWYDLGQFNGGTTIAETSVADELSYAETFTNLRAFSRLYIEATTVGGTTPTYEVDAVCHRAEPTTR